MENFSPTENLIFFQCIHYGFQVNLGIIFKDENLGEDMISITRELHGLVPVTNDDNMFDRVPVVGDQETIERGVESQFSVRSAYSKTRRLEGLFFQLADWHHENKFLSVSVALQDNTYVFYFNSIP